MEEVSPLYLYIPSLSQVSPLYTAAPVIDTPSSSTVTVNVGSSLSLSCTSRNSPPDTFTWRRDNGPVLQSTTTPVTYNANSAVFCADYSVNTVTARDNGTYTCNVTNPIGSDSAAITVVVISKLLTAFEKTRLPHIFINFRNTDCNYLKYCNSVKNTDT